VSKGYGKNEGLSRNPEKQGSLKRCERKVSARSKVMLRANWDGGEITREEGVELRGDLGRGGGGYFQAEKGPRPL